MNRMRVVVAALLLALLLAGLTVAGIQLAGEATERLTNGDFESGFTAVPGGLVPNGWSWFQNGGQAGYGFYDETWAPVVYQGQHSVLIEINTKGWPVSDPDRYAGIYQTVAVVPGESYELSMAGMLRVMEDDPDREGYNYRVQIGIDQSGGTDWKAVDNWIEVPWDTVYARLSPGTMDTFVTTVTAQGERMTLFVRAWKKWATIERELDVNLDAISLKGAMPAEKSKPTVGFSAPVFPVAGWSYGIAVEGKNDVGVTKLELYDNDELVGSVDYEVGLLELTHEFTWTPEGAGSHTLKAIAHDAGGSSAHHSVDVTVGEEGQFLVNGGFEGGFDQVRLGEVGTGWSWFYNNAQAGYGFYDETWAPAIHEGEHSQLIEINTRGRATSDPDRYAGIYQKVSGLTVGATYEFSMYGLLRVLSNDDDQSTYSYRVQWGYDPEGGTDWQAVDNWVELPWNTVYTRLAPGTMSHYSRFFEAPSEEITLFIRAWKKWGTVERELDVNLDSLTLKGYQ